MRAMNKIWIVVICAGIVTVTACNSMSKKDTANTIAKTEEVKQPQQKTSDLMFINEWVGKYPNDVKLLEQPALSKRLKALLGNNYNTMMENWNTETPITMTDSVIHTSGCKTNNCAAFSYDLYINLPTDNINVYGIKNNTVTLYTENDTISLPKKLKDELRVIISNAQFNPAANLKTTEK